eukprot:scaffold26.g3364.t1
MGKRWNGGLLPSRFQAEAFVSLVTTAALCKGLVTAGGGSGPWVLAAAALALLAAVGVAGEPLLGMRLGPRYRTRAADSTGLLAGLVAVPWALAGLAVQHARSRPARQPAGPVGAWLPAALLASALAVLGRVLPHLLAAGRGGAGPAHTAAPSDSRKRAAAKAAPWMLTVLAGGAGAVAAAACCVAAAGDAHSDRASAAGRLAAPAAAVLLGAAGAGCFHATMRLLPRTFTPGEGLLLSQAAVLLAGAAAQQGRRYFWLRQPESLFPAFVSLLLVGSVVAAAALIPLLRLAQGQRREPARQRRRRGGAAAAAAAAAVAAAAAATAARPALWLLGYALETGPRQVVLGYWAGVMAVALPGMARLAAGGLPNILVRKAYHLLALTLFLPPLFAAREPALLAAALAVAFALFATAEVVRLSGLPRVAEGLHRFLTSFTDARDGGLLLVTHFSLLLGMAAPLWLCGGAPEPGRRPALPPAALSGMLILGCGDTAASAVGRLLGRRPIAKHSKKTAEGTAAAVAATMAAWWLLLRGGGGVVAAGGADGGAVPWGPLLGATALSCLTEALTTQLDNLLVPAHYLALLCLL